MYVSLPILFPCTAVKILFPLELCPISWKMYEKFCVEGDTTSLRSENYIIYIYKIYYYVNNFTILFRNKF